MSEEKLKDKNDKDSSYKSFARLDTSESDESGEIDGLQLDIIANDDENTNVRCPARLMVAARQTAAPVVASLGTYCSTVLITFPDFLEHFFQIKLDSVLGQGLVGGAAGINLLMLVPQTQAYLKLAKKYEKQRNKSGPTLETPLLTGTTIPTSNRLLQCLDHPANEMLAALIKAFFSVGTPTVTILDKLKLMELSVSIPLSTVLAGAYVFAQYGVFKSKRSKPSEKKRKIDYVLASFAAAGALGASAAPSLALVKIIEASAQSIIYQEIIIRPKIDHGDFLIRNEYLFVIIAATLFVVPPHMYTYWSKFILATANKARDIGLKVILWPGLLIKSLGMTYGVMMFIQLILTLLNSVIIKSTQNTPEEMDDLNPMWINLVTLLTFPILEGLIAFQQKTYLEDGWVQTEESENTHHLNQEDCPEKQNLEEQDLEEQDPQEQNYGTQTVPANSINNETEEADEEDEADDASTNRCQWNNWCSSWRTRTTSSPNLRAIVAEGYEASDGIINGKK